MGVGAYIGDGAVQGGLGSGVLGAEEAVHDGGRDQSNVD